MNGLAAKDGVPDSSACKTDSTEVEQPQQAEQKQLADFIQEVKDKVELKTSLRIANVQAAESRPDESFFSKLDSSLKKNTAFIKRLRNMTDSQRDSIVKDFSSLNLTKYVSEAAAAIVEAKLKMTDIPCALHVCSLLHQRYTDFSDLLMENWQKALLQKKDDKVGNASKLRVDLRFFADLISIGVLTEKPALLVLSNQLNILINSDKEEHTNVSILQSFCKHCGDDYAGLLPRKARLLAEKYTVAIPRSQTLLPEKQRACRNLLKDYWSSLVEHLLRDYKELKSLERQNKRILHTKGELSSERQDKYETVLSAYTKLLANVEAFSDVVDEEMPQFPVEKPEAGDGGSALDTASDIPEFPFEGDLGIFDDEETRSFYENLVDLKAIVPQILYKDSEQTVVAEDVVQDDSKELRPEDVEKEIEEACSSTDPLDDGVASAADGLTGADGDADDAVGGASTDVPATEKVLLDGFLASLPTCVNRELIDKAAQEFCMNLNTKGNRKKLAKALFSVQRTRYDLLPFYARLTATLNPCMPDLAQELNNMLKSDFKYHVRKKDQINIESKLKTVRFIGELVNFKIFPKADALQCIKMLLFDFSHHNVEMVCALLDVCGRFLYCSPDSHRRTKIYLDVMMRKKSALSLDVRYNTMVENTFFYINPPECPQVTREVRPPMLEYIHKLLYADLTKVTTEKVLRQLRKLNWDDSEVKRYAIKCLIAVWNMKFSCMHCAASLLAGLAPYHEDVAISVVDGVLEEIRLGMEVNNPKHNQQRIVMAKYLGELYNYRLVDSSLIFKTLYAMITFGVSYDEEVPSALDPPEHLFRIHMVCVLLDTCGQYFNKGSSKLKLDYFLIYFQRYFWFKKKSSIWTENYPFPSTVENVVKDLLELIRPKSPLVESYEKADEQVVKLNNDFRSKLAEFLPSDDGTESDHGGGLPVIDEGTEAAESMSQSGTSQPHHGLTDGGGASEGSPSMTEHDGSHADDDDDENDRDEDDDRMDDYDGSDGGDIDQIRQVDGDDMETVTMLKSKGPSLIKCAEDDDFMAAFDKMIAETIQVRNSDVVKAPQVDISVPLNLKAQLRKQHTDNQDEEAASIKFTLMTKKGNKTQLATLEVPVSEEFAQKYREREEADRMEKEKLKKLTLDINDRQEEEDLQSDSTKLAPNTNRDRKIKYQHPKGAPDVDVIFGSKRS